MRPSHREQMSDGISCCSKGCGSKALFIGWKMIAYLEEQDMEFRLAKLKNKNDPAMQKVS